MQNIVVNCWVSFSVLWPCACVHKVSWSTV
uniref:Uncharacterized protein n=1 Tax=Anguilla anguilla TaxID=7936 RepID=A0A0E9U0C4_ANGAN